MFWMFVGGVFSTLGGLLGALIFKKQTPPGVIDIPADGVAPFRRTCAALHGTARRYRISPTEPKFWDVEFFDSEWRA